MSPEFDTVDLSIVIVSWNTRELLRCCLHSIYHAADGLRIQVVVVDNGSNDGSPEVVGREFPQADLIENPENAGFARANNEGFARAVGRHLLMLNPDTEVRADALRTLVAFMDAHADVGAAGAMLANADGTAQVSCHPEPTLSRELWRLFRLDAIWPYACYPMTDWKTNEPRQVDVVQGACVIVRRRALDMVGLLDEDYFIYSEEVDLCHRLRASGWQVYWVPAAVVVHYGGRSTSQVARVMFLRLYEGKILYFRKNRGWLAVRLYKLILLSASLARLSLGLLAWVEQAPRRQRHLAVARNYWRLVQLLPRL